MSSERNGPEGPGSSERERPAGSEPASVAVDICGRRYNIRGQYEQQRIRELAAYVDRRMRRVGEQLGRGDMVQVAVMAALNIADDYYQTRRALERRDEEVNETVQRLSRQIDAALKPLE